MYYRPDIRHGQVSCCVGDRMTGYEELQGMHGFLLPYGSWGKWPLGYYMELCICTLVTVGNKMAWRFLNPHSQWFFLPSLPYLLVYCSLEEEGKEESRGGGEKKKGNLSMRFSSLSLSPPSAIINRKIFLKDPLMASPNAKPDIFFADGLLHEGIFCPPSMPAGSLVCSSC